MGLRLEGSGYEGISERTYSADCGSAHSPVTHGLTQVIAHFLYIDREKRGDAAIPYVDWEHAVHLLSAYVDREFGFDCNPEFCLRKIMSFNASSRFNRGSSDHVANWYASVNDLAGFIYGSQRMRAAA